MTDGQPCATGTVGGVDHLRATLEQVRARTPIDAAEEASITGLLHHVERLVAAGADPFDERHDPVHITGSAIVVGPRGTVLLQHRRLGMWLQPGGHVDPGETPWDAARREAAEETGLEVAFHGGRIELVHVDVHAGGRGHTHLDLRYLLDGGAADPDPPAGESQAVGWFDWPAAVERAGDPRLAGLLAVLGRRFG
ncbi:MAG: hypothetical protein RIR49_782 [Actinomycetota bacterium]|jgi:8-oxo-dGTP pyrophosphatase MutT (NUDIX family)